VHGHTCFLQAECGIIVPTRHLTEATYIRYEWEAAPCTFLEDPIRYTWYKISFWRPKEAQFNNLFKNTHLNEYLIHLFFLENFTTQIILWNFCEVIFSSITQVMLIHKIATGALLLSHARSQNSSSVDFHSPKWSKKSILLRDISLLLIQIIFI